MVLHRCLVLVKKPRLILQSFPLVQERPSSDGTADNSSLSIVGRKASVLSGAGERGSRSAAGGTALC